MVRADSAVSKTNPTLRHSENYLDAVCGLRRPRPVCASAQAALGLRSVFYLGSREFKESKCASLGIL